MDSFQEPRKHTTVSLDDVRAQVRKLEADHRAKGIPLSGRIIHVSHYLPVTLAIAPKTANGANGHSNGGQPGIPSPPQTPPAKASDIPPSPTAEDAPSAAHSSRWQINTRYGHSAMVSGIASLTTTHEQVYVGWTGDIYTPSSQAENGFSKVASSSIPQEEREELESTLSNGKSLFKEEFPEGKPMTLAPVWLDDKQAHGHYDGYCKQSEFLFFHMSAHFSVFRC